MRKYKCSICGYTYDEAAGVPEKGIAPGTKWEDIPDKFTCLICTAAKPKSIFKLLDEPGAKPASVINNADNASALRIKELSPGEISAICSNFAKACEKQRLMPEMEAFNKIADYFKSKTVVDKGKTLADAAKMLDEDLSCGISAAKAAAEADKDRGALRSLVWCEKVSAMVKSLLDCFAEEGDAILENTDIWVCGICGFISIGEAPSDICPVCKVPKFKTARVERR